VQVVVLLLLVASLALLVLGLMTGSTPLVLASIVASLLAATAILRHRRRQEGSGAPVSTEARDGAAARVPVLAPAAGAPAAGATSPVAAPSVALSPDVMPPVVVPPAHAAGPAHAAAESQDPAETEDLTDIDPAEAGTDPPLTSRADEPVWVIDGRPRYHLSRCAFLIGREPGPEPVPLRQAVEDGFSPCALCDPDSGLAAGS